MDISSFSHLAPSPVSSSAEVGNSVNPSTLDPNFWALAIMGKLANFHLLVARLANVTKGSDEYNWLQSQMNDCKSYISNAEAAETAYETANPGKTYLSPAFCTILSQAGVQMAGTPDAFNKFYLDNLMNLGGSSGQSFFDWFVPVMQAEYAVNWTTATGPAQSDLMDLLFGTTMLLVDLDNTTLGQAGGVDAYFTNLDPVHPFQGSTFPKYGAEMFTFILYQEMGKPSSTDPKWKTFTTDLGYLANLFNPANLPTPGPSNYDSIFWPYLNKDVNSFTSGQFPNGDTFDQAFDKFCQAFNKEFTLK